MTARIPAFALALAMTLPIAARAADGPPPPHVSVLGEGEASVAPDMALLSLSVMREAPTARAALDANNGAMAAVIAAMKSSGIAERDLQTAGIQINPRYDRVDRSDENGETRIVAYQVTNTLSLRIRDVNRVGEILDKAVSLGVNQGGGISFTNDDPSATITEARRKAVADAMAKAATLAEAAGVKLGRVVEIAETNYNPPPQPYLAKAMPADAVPVQAGENSYKVQVNLTFEID